VDCLAYPYIVFSRQCQIYPYNLATPTLAAPLSSAVVLHQIAQTQVGRGRRKEGKEQKGSFLLACTEISWPCTGNFCSSWPGQSQATAVIVCNDSWSVGLPVP